MTSPVFSEDQRHDLRALGVLDRQLERLETEALPGCIALLSASPTMTDVRTELDTLAANIRATHAQLARMARNHDVGAADREALARFYGEMSDDDICPEDRSDPSALLRQLDNALRAAERALSSLPQQQRRYAAASPAPIRRIDEALKRGWADANYTIRLGDEPVTSRAIPEPYPFPPSRNGAFADVIRICYEVVLGIRDADPARAVRAYVDEVRR